MIVPAWLLRLMWRPRLSNTLRLGPEDRLAVEVADACRAWSIEGRLRGIFWHTPNEVGGAKAQARMALAKALGLIPGTPDLVFIGGGEAPAGEPVRFGSLHRILLIELKAPKGTRSANQADFAAWANHHDIAYLICRSLAEVEEALTKHGLLLPRRAP